MPTLLQKLRSQTNLQVQDIELGWGKYGMAAGLNLEYQPKSLVELLESIGLVVPGSSLENLEVDISLTWEQSRNTATKARALMARIIITGPLKLSDILEIGGLPIFPDLDKVELNFEIDQSKSADGQPVPAKDTEIGINFSFTNPSNPNNPQAPIAFEDVVLRGFHTKSTQGDTTTSGLAGNMYSLDGNAVDIDFSSVVPLDLELHDLFLASIEQTKNNQTTPLVGLYGANITIHADFDLSSLPVVGGFLSEAKFSFESLRFTYSKTAIASQDLDTVNAFLSQVGIPALTTAQNQTASGNTKANIPKGFTLQGSLVVGDKTIQLHSDVKQATPPPASPNQQNAPTPLSPATSSSTPTPTPVSKQFGPVHIKDISLGLDAGKILFQFNGGFKLGLLVLDFIQLDISNPLKHFDPSISLQGLAVNVENPPLSLEGLFMEGTVNIPIKDASGNVTLTPITAYDGLLTVGFGEYHLTLEGSYAQLPDGSASVFLYGFLGAPLGGIPLLYITGVALGFGYNRDLTLPSAENIGSHPLIQPIMNPTIPPKFDDMNKDFLPDEGAFWGAVGLRIETFQMISTFALLALKFGRQFEVDILGISDMEFPVQEAGDPEPPLARIKIGVVARMVPERGVLSVQGAFLPGSYIYLPQAHISGGFAMLTIAKDQNDGEWNGEKAGDFIFTLGGYASSYQPKAFYPRVSRLALTWQVSSALSVKAQQYFAITPEAMMVGGHVMANFQEGGSLSIHVYFVMGADLIIYWKPYHYLGHIYAELNVAANISVDCWLFTIHMHIDFDLSADLRIYGPPFSGTANVRVHMIVSFSVSVSFGAHEQAPQPISWAAFSSGFLPAMDKILTCAIGSGLITNHSEANKSDNPPTEVYPLVNAKELSFSCKTIIPVKNLQGIPGIAASNTDFGIKSMGNTSADFSQSEMTVSITKDGTQLSDSDLTDHFDIEPIQQNMPHALWASAPSSGVVTTGGSVSSDNSLITDLLTGVRVSAKPATPAGNPFQVPANEMDELHADNSAWGAAFAYGETYNLTGTNG